MLFLGTVRSPSYLAELRALRLAAATCDRLRKRALVIKFAVRRGPPRWTSPEARQLSTENDTSRDGAQCLIRGDHPSCRDSIREPLHLVRGSPVRERHDSLFVSELRQTDDWALCTLSGPVGRVSMPGLFLRRPMRCHDGIRGRHIPRHARRSEDGSRAAQVPHPRTSHGLPPRPPGTACRVRLTAILAVALVSDAEGGSDRLEETLAAIPGVGSVETIDVTLV